MEIVCIFPHQLFEKHPGLKKGRLVFLIEDPRFFSDFQFHVQKLIFHRASLKNYATFLKKKGYQTQYIEEDLKGALQKMKVQAVYTAQLEDDELEKKLFSLAKSLHFELKIEKSPHFLTDMEEFESIFKGEKQIRFDRFYMHQRKKLEILLDGKGKPLGGKWSLDQENRKKLPKSVKLPRPFKATCGKEVKEAIRYVKKKYPKNPGELDHFNFPTTHVDAKRALRHFIENRLSLFGDYEDAIVQKEGVLFHSCLSPLLNVGLLNPDEVIKAALESFKKGKIPLNSIEGFVRQVIGWREYVRGIYHVIGRKQRLGNFFHHKRKMPASFYTGTTGIFPIDETIQKLRTNAYLHHIERLMVLGNFFLLCEIDPNEVYRWFMELFIDSYDWVMVPNVYGMSQYADGGMMTTKPYFSGSNYILKMSDYPKGKWCDIWDALFWRFMIQHETFFSQQPRLSMLCKIAKKKKKDIAFLRLADDFLKKLK